LAWSLGLEETKKAGEPGKEKKMNKSELKQVFNLAQAGVSMVDGIALKNAAAGLHRWYEAECGNGRFCINRDNDTGKPYRDYGDTGRRYYIRDMEKANENKISGIMAKHPELGFYLQGDPRGATLYIYKLEELAGRNVRSCYNSVALAWF
jgi:hypothetical protein